MQETNPTGHLSDAEREASGFSTSRARMLVTLLGSEFTKSVQHPFFRRIAQRASDSAVGRKDEVANHSDNLTDALQSLVQKLESSERTTGSHSRRSDPSRVAQDASSDSTAIVLGCDGGSETTNQHPLLICEALQELPPEDVTELVSQLPAKTALQVLKLMSA